MKSIRLWVWMIVLLSASATLLAQNDLRKKHYNLGSQTLAIQGYDPVAYFTEKKAVKGRKDFALSHEGVLYYFASAANKDAFRSNPKAYEPQYGGWCAYAMGATGEKVEIDPETFTILQGKLYLFYHSWSNNTLTKWKKDEANLQKKADQNWRALYR